MNMGYHYNDRNTRLIDVIEDLRDFNKSRGFDQFEQPGQQLVAASIELGELQSHFLWLDEGRYRGNFSEVADEFADVMIYMINFADAMGIDVLEAIGTKMTKNIDRFPDVAEGRGEER
jgi:NTP pyrophosphatase (non-canonical NTP hydrolase)